MQNKIFANISNSWASATCKQKYHITLTQSNPHNTKQKSTRAPNSPSSHMQTKSGCMLPNIGCIPAAQSAKILTAAPGLQQGLDADLKETWVLLAGHFCGPVSQRMLSSRFFPPPAWAGRWNRLLLESDAKQRCCSQRLSQNRAPQIR